MESAHHSVSRRDWNSTADVPSLTLHTALSAMHSSRIDEVLKFDDSMTDGHNNF